MEPVATFHSPFKTKFGIPRQAGVVEQLPGYIVFSKEYRSVDAIRGLEGFDYLWLIWRCSKSSSLTLSIPSQGNVRCVVRHDGTLVESNEYYPYGTPFTTAGAVQPYKYGAKELDRMHGLDLYDSEAIQV